MVKKGQILGPRGEFTKDGRPRQPPGRKPPPPDIRGDRLVLRVHPDLITVLTKRAKEVGISRSQYVEKIVLGWVRGDPRNPRLDAIGRRTRAMTPADFRRLNPIGFGQAWARFEQLSDLLLDERPKRAWFEESLPADFWADEDSEFENGPMPGSPPDEGDTEEPTTSHTTLNPYRKSEG